MSRLIFFFGIFLLSTPAYAYLDAGLGSLILQGLIGSLAIVVGYISLFWNKIKTFTLKFRKDSNIKNTKYF